MTLNEAELSRKEERNLLDILEKNSFGLPISFVEMTSGSRPEKYFHCWKVANCREKEWQAERCVHAAV